MTSSNGNSFRITGPLWGESTGHRWIPLTKASDAELWSFLWTAPEQTFEQTIEAPVIWDAIAHIMTSLWCCKISITYHRGNYNWKNNSPLSLFPSEPYLKGISILIPENSGWIPHLNGSTCTTGRFWKITQRLEHFCQKYIPILAIHTRQS